MAAHPERLVLASASPRRKELLERLSLRFEIDVADVDEDGAAKDGPEQMVLSNAELKATTVAARSSKALVLGSDTTVVLDGEVLNKPVDMDEARAMLRRLSGVEHTVWTAVALVWESEGFSETFVEASEVRFLSFDDRVIDAYFEQVNPLDKAGAYGIQQARELIIESVQGSVANVMGLPIETLEERLLEHGFDFHV